MKKVLELLLMVTNEKLKDEAIIEDEKTVLVQNKKELAELMKTEWTHENIEELNDRLDIINNRLNELKETE